VPASGVNEGRVGRHAFAMSYQELAHHIPDHRDLFVLTPDTNNPHLLDGPCGWQARTSRLGHAPVRRRRHGCRHHLGR
jgi:hypothetical protein